MTFTQLCREYGDRVDSRDPTLTNLHRLVVKVWDMAMDGDMKALRELLARIDPEVKQVLSVGVSGDIGQDVLRRMLEDGTFPVREGYTLPTVVGIASMIDPLADSAVKPEVIAETEFVDAVVAGAEVVHGEQADQGA